MNRKHALAVAALSVLAVPAFAQTNCFLDSSNLQMTCPSPGTTILGAGPAITSSNGAVVSSGTGVVVTPGAPVSNVILAPSADVALATAPGIRVLPGATMVEAGQSTAVLGAGPAVIEQPVTTTAMVAQPVTTTRLVPETVTTHRWVREPVTTTRMVRERVTTTAMVQEPVTTTVLGAGPAIAAPGSQVLVTRYWVNVPANVESRADFQRWLALKP